MKREEIRSTIEQAIADLQAGRNSEALATLQKLATDLAPRSRRVQPPAVDGDFQQTDLDALQDAYRRAMAGTITAAEVHQLIEALRRLPVAQAVALARAFGCTWVPLRATRTDALAAVADRLLGPIHARERATF